MVKRTSVDHHCSFATYFADRRHAAEIPHQFDCRAVEGFGPAHQLHSRQLENLTTAALLETLRWVQAPWPWQVTLNSQEVTSKLHFTT